VGPGACRLLHAGNCTPHLTPASQAISHRGLRVGGGLSADGCWSWPRPRRGSSTPLLPTTSAMRTGVQRLIGRRAARQDGREASGRGLEACRLCLLWPASAAVGQWQTRGVEAWVVWWSSYECASLIVSPDVGCFHMQSREASPQENHHTHHTPHSYSPSHSSARHSSSCTLLPPLEISDLTLLHPAHTTSHR
jgi:hypothetical protein